MRLVITWLLTWLFAVSAFANFAEFFGSSTGTTGLGGQTNFYGNDPANNYYHPSLLSFGTKVGLSFNSYYVHHDFNPIENVLIRNSQNSDDNVNGDIATNYEGVYYGALHAVLPILSPNGNKFGISIFTPLTELAEVNTGDPFLTEYVMYRARYKRTMAYANMAFPLSKNSGFSVGIFTGLQTNSDVFLRTSVGDPDFNTYSRVKANVTPSLGAMMSYSMLLDPHTFSLTLQQEMKSKLESTTVGSNANPQIFLNFSIDSMLYYDPYIVRFSYGLNKRIYKILATVEYQIWSGYEPPTLRINQNDSNTINSSKNFETINIRDIVVPKLGYLYNFSDSTGLLLGVGYKPSPLDSDFSGGGNSVDTDSFITSLGMTYKFKLFKKRSELSFSGQYHHLVDKTVTKTTLDEQGGAGSKIGAPGYKIGGAVINSSVGLKVYF